MDSSFLAAVAPADREALAERAAVRELPRRDVLFRQGEPATALYFALEGRIKLTQLTADGQEVIVRYVGPGEVFAGVALLGGTSYPVTAEAAQDSRVLAWPAAEVQEVAASTPSLALATTRVISERMREVQDRFRELATERVARRVARSLLRLARQAGRRTEDGVLIDMPLSRQDLAEMNGTTLYTVSRLLSEWEGQGIVDAGRQRVVVREPHRLVALAEDLPP
ncbi:MAG: Crp/Fnr family transcriptional regulator [Thermoanaerobaculia bacterium]